MDPTSLNFKIMHIGINCEDHNSALNTAEFLEKVFNISKSIGKDSIFSSSFIEIMKGSGRGTHGHIAIGTNDLLKAKQYLEFMGLEFDEDSKKYDETGAIIVIYLKQEIAGFAMHLLQN
jgi:2-dehydro-3-deoxyphosphogluconate aldolase/(4S)-4-hydroxy-2-oxoglutarate aldolase